MKADALVRGRVLLVEDEEYVRGSLQAMLSERGYEVALAGSAEEAVRLSARTPVDVVLTDLKLPGGSGLHLIKRLRAGGLEVPVVVLTGHGTIPSAVACMREGASDYLLKPADPDVLEATLERALEKSEKDRELAYLRGQDEPLALGESDAWREVLRKVRAAAQSDATVLFLGESGTGKELLTRLLHRTSARASGPLVRVNCAATPLDMWESEFFGHRKGAFTGATADREGRFRLAHRGTLFMDEVGAMPFPAQAKTLRVLQDGEFDRLGDERPTRVDVRVVCATNADLEAEVAAGRFRQDLYYRLAVVPIRVPPLHERMADIPLLARALLSQIAARLGRPAPELSERALAELQAYPFPGNVRELKNVLERALILNADAAELMLDLPPTAAATTAEPGTELGLQRALGVREREIVIEALRRAGGVKKEAARLLGIDARNVGYYLRKHGIES